MNKLKRNDNFRMWKSGKQWLFASTAVMSMIGAGAAVGQTVTILGPATVVYAAELPQGATSVGTINGKNVYQSPTQDMESETFQQIVDKIVSDSNLKGVRYLASNVGWNDNTSAIGGTPLSNFRQALVLALGPDGFNGGDAGYLMSRGNSFMVNNVGKVTDVKTNSEMDVHMKVTLVDFQKTGESAGGNKAVVGVKNQGGVITLGIVNSIEPGEAYGYDSSGISEGGTGLGSAGNNGGRTIGWIDSVVYRFDLVNAQTGEILPDNETAILIKASDVDASQLTTFDTDGTLGYIVGPNTKLSVSGAGMVSNGEDTVPDYRTLSANSYLAIKKSSHAQVSYKYTDGRNNHYDIVSGIFGNTGLELKPNTGKIEIFKSLNNEEVSKLIADGKTDDYSLESNEFKITNTETGESYTIRTDNTGKAVTDEIPFGTYTVEEISTGKGTSVGFETTTVTLNEENKTASEEYIVTLNALNTANMGLIKINKAGAESGKEMWNSNYSLEGTTFKFTHETGKEYTAVADAGGYINLGEMLLGTYDVEEVKPGKGFRIGFEKQQVTFDDSTREISLNATNPEITGKVKINKSGTETGKEMWNNLYSLAGNEFKLTNKENGKEYTVVTNANGEAEVDHMQLGEYTVEEIKASNGFARTFKTTTATLLLDENNEGKLEFDVEGTNQEITGSNILVKEDLTNGKTATGQGSLVGAEYALFHANGQPVTWSETAKATVIGGEKATTSIINGKEVDNGDNVVVRITNPETVNIGVERLALGTYYWQEVNAPEGYVLDTAKHTFTIAKKDDETTTVKSEDTKSTELPITARIKMQKLIETMGGTSLSGANDITFTATPINGTKAEAKEFTTTIKDDEDGYTEVELEYGDWKITENEAPIGYELIKPIYIHMSYDSKKDIYTITASINEDGSEPFSTRQFTQSDNSNEKNENTTGTVAGVLSSTNTTISLSKITAVDKATPPPVFIPRKFDVESPGLDITGEALADDDAELKNAVIDTANNVYSDKTDNNETWNLNTENVVRGQNITYQLWMDTTKLLVDGQYENIGMEDTFDAVNFIPNGVEDIKVYNKTTGEDVTSQLDINLENGKLTVKTNDSVKKIVTRFGKEYKVIDTSKFAFGTYYQIEFSGKVAGTTPDETDIINSASQFVTQIGGRQFNELTETRVNKVTSPKFNPHKYNVENTGINITNTDLSKDDSELQDVYADTAKDPYSDKVDNNVELNNNTETMIRGEGFAYQLWMDTTEFTDNMNLRSIGMTDDYDEAKFDLDNLENVRVYNKTTGEDVTSQFDITAENGELKVETNNTVKKAIKVGETEVLVIDTDKFAYGTQYQIDVPGYVSASAKDGEDIVNVGKQFVKDAASDTNPEAKTEKTTETRVNKVKSLEFNPHKFNVKAPGLNINNQDFLDDDSELTDRYADTAKDPYADKVDNNDETNNNTLTLVRGQKYNYQLWMDTTTFTSNMNLRSVGMTDKFAGDKFKPEELSQIKVHNKTTGEDVTSQFDITLDGNVLTVETNDSVKKTVIVAGKEVKVIDTDKFAYGTLYQIDFPGSVSTTVKDGEDIVNVATQFVRDITSDGNPEAKIEKTTETRVNKVKSPEFNPHKFNLNAEKLDIVGNVLLDDDSELEDRYKDTAADVYADKPTNNEEFNLNTIELKRGNNITYQLWMDTVNFTDEMNLTNIGMEDDYAEAYLEPTDLENIRVYNSETGQDVTKLFDVKLEGGKLRIVTNDEAKKKVTFNGEEKSLIDTAKLPYGIFYKIDFTTTIKSDVPSGTDIVNVASQFVEDIDGNAVNKNTETRVNKVKDNEPPTEQPKEQPKEQPQTPSQTPKNTYANTGVDNKGSLIFAGLGASLLGALAFLNREKLKSLFSKKG